MNELKIYQANEIQGFLEISERKDWLINESNLREIDKNIELVRTLVYPATDEGGKEAKKTVAIIRKYAKSFLTGANNEFKERAALFTKAKQAYIDRAGVLNTIAQGISDQQAEITAAKLAEIRELLVLELAYAWNDLGVSVRFQADTSAIEKAVSLQAITPKGALTKKARDYVIAIAAKNKERQTLIESRKIILENKCMKAGVESSALTEEYIGPAFYGTDDEFNSRIDILLDNEVRKKEETEKRIEAEKQRAIDAALAAQQAEADRIARAELHQNSDKPEGDPIAYPASKKLVDESAMQCHSPSRDEPGYREPVEQKSTVVPIKKPAESEEGKHPVRITFTIEKMIRDGASDQAVNDHFINKILPPELKELLVSCSAETVKKAG